MWLSKILSDKGGNEKAESGYITLNSDEQTEASSSFSARDISSYNPYGYLAKAPVGTKVLLLPSSDGVAALGCVSPESALSAGEIEIKSMGGASIVLKNNGSVIINGAFEINSGGQVISHG